MKGQWYRRLWPWIIVSVAGHLVLIGTVNRPVEKVVSADVLYEVTLLYRGPVEASTGRNVPKASQPPAEDFSDAQEEPLKPESEEVLKAEMLSEPKEVTEVVEPEEKRNDGVLNQQYGMTQNRVQEARKEPKQPDTAPVIEGLKRRIEETRTYPYVARKRGLQGVVRLALRLDEKGNLIELVVTESSGYGVLDDAATALVEKVVPYPHGLGTTLSVDIPIRYSLVN
ncbi:MAG: TonB family protein [Spirochaetes bacterium]|nr:TonB family protein [Spirochaetota bacterium]